jgi:hypothetical protein
VSHHDLCPKHRWSAAFYVHCQCYLIKEAQALERQRIRAAVDSMWAYDDGRVSKDLVLDLIDE